MRIVRNTKYTQRKKFINIIAGGTYSYHWALNGSQFSSLPYFKLLALLDQNKKIK
jgi:hypothetical protein